MDKTEVKPENYNEKNKIVIDKPTGNQRKLFSNMGAAAIGGLGAGIGIAALYSMTVPQGDTPEPEIEEEVEDGAPVVIYTDAPVSSVITEDMSFGEAFAAAREDIGPGGFFYGKDNLITLITKKSGMAYLTSKKTNISPH